jgi:protein-S-isoprenylcysteine O-methyltransferase Ste14
MGKAGGFGLLISGIVLVILGAVLRWDLIDWLIDTTGLILILIGVVLLIIGGIQMLSNKNSSDF